MLLLINVRLYLEHKIFYFYFCFGFVLYFVDSSKLLNIGSSPMFIRVTPIYWLLVKMKIGINFMKSQKSPYSLLMHKLFSRLKLINFFNPSNVPSAIPWILFEPQILSNSFNFLKSSRWMISNSFLLKHLKVQREFLWF